jgi:hypothetical protein
MRLWPDDLKLLAILAATEELVGRSTEEGWGDERPEQIGMQTHHAPWLAVRPRRSCRRLALGGAAGHDPGWKCRDTDPCSSFVFRMVFLFCFSHRIPMPAMQ